MIGKRTISPQTNKALLIVNVIVCLGALVLSILDISYREYTSAIAMLGVMVVTAYNIYGCWKRMKGKL